MRKKTSGRFGERMAETSLIDANIEELDLLLSFEEERMAETSLIDANMEELDLLLSFEEVRMADQQQQVSLNSNSTRGTVVDVEVHREYGSSGGRESAFLPRLRNRGQARRVNYDAHDWEEVSPVMGADQPIDQTPTGVLTAGLVPAGTVSERVTGAGLVPAWIPSQGTGLAPVIPDKGSRPIAGLEPASTGTPSHHTPVRPPQRNSSGIEGYQPLESSAVRHYDPFTDANVMQRTDLNVLSLSSGNRPITVRH